MDGACILLGLTLVAHAADNRSRFQPLTDGELGRVTAGSTQLKGSEAGGRGGIIVLNGSSATVVTNSTVDLAPLVPGQVRALNLVNASTSLVANAVNVSVGRADPLFIGLFPPVNQSSQVSQDHRRFAYIDQWSPGGLYVTQSSHHSFSRSHSSSSFFKKEVVSLSTFRRSSVVESIAQVPTINLFPSSLQLPAINPNPFEIPKFGLDFGIASASIGPTRITPPGITFPALDLSKDTLTLSGGSISLPKIESSVNVSVGICPVCFSGSLPFTLPPFGGDLAKISIPSVPLGPNPFKDTVIQVGSGLAFAGTGTFTASEARLKMTASLTVQIPPIKGPEIKIPDVSIHVPIVDTDISATGPTIKLPDINFPSILAEITLINASFPGFTLEAKNAAVCIQVNGQCTIISASFEEHSETIETTTVTQSSSSQWTEQRSYEGSQQIVLPPVLTGARGEFFALGGGSLSATDSTSVKLSGPVHQGVRAVNLVTVSGTTLANVANIGTTGSLARGLALGQLNTISQRH